MSKQKSESSKQKSESYQTSPWESALDAQQETLQRIVEEVQAHDQAPSPGRALCILVLLACPTKERARREGQQNARRQIIAAVERARGRCDDGVKP